MCRRHHQRGSTGWRFDELGLDRHAAICRPPGTAEVHAAYRRSDAEASLLRGCTPSTDAGTATSTPLGSDRWRPAVALAQGALARRHTDVPVV